MSMEKRGASVQISGVKRKPKSSGKSSALVPQPHGGALVPGAGAGRQPGAGRPPDEFKRRIQAMVSNDQVLAYLGECLQGDHGAMVAVAAWKHMAERGYGKVPQPIEGVEGKPLTVQIVVPERKA